MIGAVRGLVHGETASFAGGLCMEPVAVGVKAVFYEIFVPVPVMR